MPVFRPPGIPSFRQKNDPVEPVGLASKSPWLRPHSPATVRDAGSAGSHHIEGVRTLLKPDPGAPLPAAGTSAPIPGADAVSGRPGRLRDAVRTLAIVMGLIVQAFFYLGAASLVAFVIVRVGADWLDGRNPLGGAERPRLYPRQMAARELALDVTRQIALAGLVIGIAHWRDRTGWRRRLGLASVAGGPPGLSPLRLGAILLVWPFLHIAWVTAAADIFQTPFGRRVALSPTLSATTAAIWLTYVTVLAPFAEELLMRGAVFARGVVRLGPAGTILVTSLLFAGAHVAPAGLARPVSLLPLALMLGWLRWRSGRLWPCILLHGWSNLAMIAYVLTPAEA